MKQRRLSLKWANFKKLKVPALCIALMFLFGYFIYEENQFINAESTGIVSVSSFLNVREGAGTNYKIVGSLANGTQITILEEAGNGWYKIKNNSITGYVSSKYITMNVIDEEFKQNLIDSGFPESYTDALALLHAQYPNWEFVPMQTGLEWDTVIANETALGKNNISSSSISSWKSVEKGAYNLSKKTWVAMDGASWVPASKSITEYYMDPRNFLDATTIFQFLNHTYDSSKQDESTLSSMVTGTFLAGTYKENNNNVTYSSTLMDAANQSTVNPYVLASMILVEQGNKGSCGSISGTVSGYEGYYNFFNIGAYAASSMTAVQRGLWFAKGSGSNATSYNRPWNSATKSIIGGSAYYGKNYVQAGQNTLYLKKFNVQGTYRYCHQYMTNVQGAASEASKLSNAYTSIKNSTLVFYIPVYQNMPASAVSKPTGDGDPNNYLKSLSVDGYSLNPKFGKYKQAYSLIIDSPDDTIHISGETYESTSTVSGIGDIKLTEGMNTVNITVKAKNGETRTYVLTISKTGGTTENESDDNTENGSEENTGNVSENNQGSGGKVGAYTITNSYMTGLAASMDVDTLIANMKVTDGTVTVYKSDKEMASGTVGTGCVVKISDDSGNVLEEYTVLIYGDINGDGKLSIADLLKTQKVLLDLETVSGAYSKASDVNKDGKISITDLLKIQKSLLGLETLTQ